MRDNAKSCTDVALLKTTVLCDVTMNINFLKTNKYIYDESLFRLSYSLSMLLSFVSIIELPFQILSYTMMLWGLFLLVKKIKSGQIFKIKFVKLFILFLSCMLFTTFLNIRNNFFMNLLMCYHVAICFFIFYGMHSENDAGKIKQEMITLCCIVIKISTILSVIGIVIALFWPRFSVLGYGLGLMEDRYNGVYTNPNLAAFVSVISIICCHIIFNFNLIQHRRYKTDKKIIPDRLLFFASFVNFMALLLSDSNASLLFLLAYGCIFLIFYNLRSNYNRSFKVKLLNLLWILIICIAFCMSIILMRIGVQYSIAEFMNNIHSVQYVPSTSGTDTIDDVITIGRSTTNYEVSSGRLDAWSKALVLYSYNPLFGIGKSNILHFGEIYLSNGFLYSDLHNAYMSILVSYGLLGFVLFLLITIYVCRYIIKALKKTMVASKGTELIILFSAISAYCAYSFFEKALLLDITFIVIYFWLFLGYTMSYIASFSKGKVNEANKTQVQLAV